MISPFLVKYALLLEHLGEDWYGGVDRIRYDADHRLGAMFRASHSEITDDRGICILRTSGWHKRPEL